MSLTLQATHPAGAELPRAASRSRELNRWFARYPQVSIGAIIVLALVLLTLAAPILGRYDPTTMDTSAPLKGPSLSHFFGTDNFGRDVYSRTLFGYRASLTAAVGSYEPFSGST